MRIDLETTIGFFIAIMIKDEWTIIHNIIVKDGMWTIISISRIDLEATIMMFWIAWDVDMHGADVYPNSKVAIHTSEAILLDYSETTFNGYAWRGWVVILRDVLRYPKAILANIQTTIQKAKAMDSLGIHWHFVDT